VGGRRKGGRVGEREKRMERGREEEERKESLSFLTGNKSGWYQNKSDW